jgi:hypothetical protein
MVYFFQHATKHSTYLQASGILLYGIKNMKTKEEPLTLEILQSLGFKIDESKTKDRITTLSKNNFHITVVDDGSVFYPNLGFDYPLPTLSELQKVYKQVKREELKAGE